MASALETLCGQAYGAKQYHMMGIYLQRSWIVLFLSSVLLLPMFIFPAPILKLMGQPESEAERTGLVAKWLIPFHLSFPFQFTLQRFLQSQLKTAAVAWVCGTVLAIHGVLSWVFVCKLRVGIVGAALTIDFAWWLSVLGLFGYTVCGGALKHGLVFQVKLLLVSVISLSSLWLLGSCCRMCLFILVLVCVTFTVL